MKVCRILSVQFMLLLTISLQAQENLPQLLESLHNASGDSATVSCYLRLINYYSRHSLDSLNLYADRALAYSGQKGYKLGEGQIYKHLAVIDANQGRVTVAHQRAELALSLFRELRNMKEVAEELHDLGALEADKGNYDVAIRYFINALHVYDTVIDYHGQMLAYMNLGNLYLAHSDTANARKYLDIAQVISRKLPLNNESIFLYNVIGVVHALSGDKTGALKILKDDLALSNKPAFLGSHVECLLYLEEFYVDEHNFPSALAYLDEGLKLSESNNLLEMEANFLTDKAKIEEQTHPDSAIVYLERSRVICEHIQSKSFLSNVYEEIEDYYERKGDYLHALNAFKQKQKIQDSLFSISKTQEIESLGAAFDQEKSKSRIAQLELQHKEEANTRNVIIAIGSAITITLLILIFMYRRAKVLYQKLRENEQKLKELNHTKDKLFSIIGHDLRGPISSIPVLLNILEEENTDVEERHYILNSLKEHAIATTDTLDKLLFWGKSVLSGATIKREQFATKQIINRNIDLKKLAASEKQISICDNTAEDLSIFADSSHFDFIFRNLLDNSVKFTPVGGTITIEAAENALSNFTVFSVSDTGIGINQSQISQIFMLNQSTPGTAQEKGSGIGLTLCKEFARQNGGDLWVKSKEGEGTTFFYSVKKSG